MTCVICDKRPAHSGGYCHNCDAQINSKAKRSPQPSKFLTYRGIVVGMYPNGDGTLKPRLLKRSPENLPKGKTLDLNTYLPGFTRPQIKKMKTACLQLASA